jgi:hypothetical protein
VPYYLAEKYEIELLDAVALVRRNLDAVFAAVDRRQSIWFVANTLASLAGLVERPVPSHGD